MILLITLVMQSLINFIFPEIYNFFDEVLEVDEVFKEDVMEEWEWSDPFWNDFSPVHYITDVEPAEDWDSELLAETMGR